MITPQQQTQIDAIKAKYNYKPPQVQQQNDWFTATAPKPKLPLNPVEDAAIGFGKGMAGFGSQADTLGTMNRLQKGDTSDVGKDKMLSLIDAANPLKTMTKMAGGNPDWAGTPPEHTPSESPDWTGMSPAQREQAFVPTNKAQQVGSTAALLAVNAAPLLPGIARGATAMAGKVKSVLPNPPQLHPIDSIRGYADTKMRTSIQQDVTNLLKATKPIGKRVGEISKSGTDLHKILADPQVFQGLKVENGKINPTEAIDTIDSRIQPLLESKRAILPKIDEIVGTTPKSTILQKAIENVKGKYSPADEARLIRRIEQQVAPLPENLKPSQIDALRAQFRTSARDAKGQMKSDSEYAALEKASMQTVFDITDNLPVHNASEYKALNDYVKQMISTKDFLEKNLRNQVVKGGRMGTYSLKLLGAMAGTTHGPLGTIAGHIGGGVVADILVNNQLGSSFKMSLIRNLTDDPVILAKAEELLKGIQDIHQPQLPEGNPANNHPVLNQGKPIQVGENGPREYVGPETRVGNYQLSPKTLEPTNQAAPSSAMKPSTNNMEAKVAQPAEKASPPNLLDKARQFGSQLKDNMNEKGAIINPLGGKKVTPTSFKDSVAANVGKELESFSHKAPQAGEIVDIEGINRLYELQQLNAKRALTTAELQEAVGLLRKQGVETVPMPAPLNPKLQPNADTVSRHIESTRTLVETMPPESTKAAGGDKALMARLKTNIVDGLRAEAKSRLAANKPLQGEEALAQTIERVNVADYPTLNDFIRKIQDLAGIKDPTFIQDRVTGRMQGKK